MKVIAMFRYIALSIYAFFYNVGSKMRSYLLDQTDCEIDRVLAGIQQFRRLNLHQTNPDMTAQQLIALEDVFLQLAKRNRYEFSLFGAFKFYLQTWISSMICGSQIHTIEMALNLNALYSEMFLSSK